MTGWHIRAGYSSKFLVSDVEAMLRTVVDEVRIDVAALQREVVDESEQMRECLCSFADAQQCALTERVNGDGDLEYMLLASGGGPFRQMKEDSRRAFVRLVMKRMHGVGMDICVVVA